MEVKSGIIKDASFATIFKLVAIFEILKNYVNKANNCLLFTFVCSKYLELELNGYTVYMEKFSHKFCYPRF